jgi:hypothetical protein
MCRTLLARLVVLAFVATVPVCRVDAQVPAPMPVLHVDPGTSHAGIVPATRFSMSIGTPIQVRDALLLLVRGTNFSIVLDPGVRGTFVGDLKNVTLREALAAVLLPGNLTYTMDGTVIRVSRRRTESRFFEIDFVDVRRTWQGTLQSDGGALRSIAGGDPFDDIQQGIEALLSSDGRAHVDRRAGLISVNDYPEQLDRVGAYVEALSSRSLRQVRVQARLVDAVTRTTVSIPEVVGMNNEPVVLRSGERGGIAFSLTVVPQIAVDDSIQLSVSPTWTDGTARAGASDVVSRIRSGATLVVPVAEHMTVEVTATIAERASGGL